MNKKSILQNIFIGLISVCLTASAAFVQTTAFTYQGKLTNNGTPATGSYEMRFRHFNQVENGFQFGTPKTILNVAIANGVFTVRLDVGDWTFDQNDRFIEIALRPQGNTNPFTVLAPLQQITLAVALDSNKLGGVNASEYVTTSSVGNSFIKNATTQRTANFNISGNGFLGDNVGIGTTTPQSKLEVNGEVAVNSGGSGGQLFFAAPNGETGMLIKGKNRADIRFDGSTLKLLAGTNTGASISTNGIAISQRAMSASARQILVWTTN